MSLAAALFWSGLIVGGITAVGVAGALLVRRWVTVEVLERHNDVAGFIYAVIGVLYAVLLGFTAIIVWERFDEAQTNVEKEANELVDLFRNAQAFAAEDFREELETNLRSYVRLVIEKEWPAMAEGESSPDAWDAINRIWQTCYRFRPQNEDEGVWSTQSLTRLNQLGDQRRLRLLSSQSEGVPPVMWGVLLGAGAITIGFSFLFGTKNTVAQALMTAGLAMTIALVLLSILALQQPFGGITRIEPEAFNQTKKIFDSVPAAQFGIAKAMLEKAVAAVKEDKAKALDIKGEGGFKDRDLYVFCANASDGLVTAHPDLEGKHLQDIKGKKGHPLGQEMMQNATEGTIKLPTGGRALVWTSRWRRRLSTRRSATRFVVSAITWNESCSLNRRSTAIGRLHRMSACGTSPGKERAHVHGLHRRRCAQRSLLRSR